MAKKDNRKKVIDGDYMICLEYFDKDKSREIYEKYIKIFLLPIMRL